ncbi:MAG TPA: GFA family protein [Caulobacteraceae bacterium]|jgi:hypothetical protein
MDWESLIRGQCLCGAVQFQLTPPLDTLTHCHCRSCRLSRGVAFVTWTSTPPERFAFTKGESEVAWRRSSATVRWGSCRICSSPMFYVADQAGHPEAPTLNHVYVSVGSLTSPIEGRPAAHVSWEEHVGWIEGVDDLPKFRGKTEERMD